MKALPQFERQDFVGVEDLVSKIFTNHASDETHFVTLVEGENNAYRVLFDSGYFVLPEGQEHPSKSQWNTLKKKFKRHNPRIFVFKDYGYTLDGLCFLDFGFFGQ